MRKNEYDYCKTFRYKLSSAYNGLCKNSGIRLFLHALGLSALGASLFLELSVFSSIFQHGYFRAIEQNMVVLYSEIFLSGCAVLAFC